MNGFQKAALLAVFGVVITVAALFLPSGAVAAEKFVTIGTGGITGVYYPAGGAICRLVNRGRKEHGIRCSVESTNGSVYNIHAIHEGELDFGVAQSDWQFHAYRGTSIFSEDGPFENLRTIFSLHSEPFTVVARKDSGIKSFDDLKGKRVNIGDQGSGARATMDQVMAKKGWTKAVFGEALEMKSAEQGQALCSGKIDAFVHAVGHPNGLVQEVTASCGAVLVPVTGPEIDALIKENPFYSKTVIPGGMYGGNGRDVPTFGVKATLVTSATTDPEVVYQLVRAVFENFDNFKTLHPVFATLDPRKMIFEGNSAPLHDGAIRYYKEKGLL